MPYPTITEAIREPSREEKLAISMCRQQRAWCLTGSSEKKHPTIIQGKRQTWPKADLDHPLKRVGSLAKGPRD